MATPSTIKDLQDLRRDLAAEMRKMADSVAIGEKFTAEQQVQWEKVNADYQECVRLLDIKQAAQKAIDDTTAPSGNTGNAGRGNVSHEPAPVRRKEDDPDFYDPARADRDFQLAVSAWVLNKTEPDCVTEEHKRACRRFGVQPANRELRLRLSPTTQQFERRQRLFRTKKADAAYEESRALSTQVGQSIGYTVAPLFNADIESALLYYGPMVQIATPIRTTTAATYPMPTDNETSKTGAYTDENTAVTTTEGVTINVVNFGAYKATTNAILVPYEAFRDSAIDLNGYLSSKLGERLGRFINTEATTGSVKCKGIVTTATAGVTTASSSAIAMDEVLALVHQIDPAYRDMPGTGFMFNDAILLALRKLKDGEGRYLWSAGTTASEPDRLWGKPYYINNDMAGTMATTAITMLFGHLPHYHLRTVSEIRLTMSDQRYWESDQTAFAAYMYFDGNLVDAGTHPVKKLTHV